MREWVGGTLAPSFLSLPGCSNLLPPSYPFKGPQSRAAINPSVVPRAFESESFQWGLWFWLCADASKSPITGRKELSRDLLTVTPLVCLARSAAAESVKGPWQWCWSARVRWILVSGFPKSLADASEHLESPFAWWRSTLIMRASSLPGSPSGARWCGRKSGLVQWLSMFTLEPKGYTGPQSCCPEWVGFTASGEAQCWALGSFMQVKFSPPSKSQGVTDKWDRVQKQGKLNSPKHSWINNN